MKKREIVITAFLNEAMPPFRYRTGDISSLEDECCECGSELPRLCVIKGRMKNIIMVNEKSFSVESMDDALCTLPWLRQYDIAFERCACGGGLTVTVLDSEHLDVEEIRTILSTVVPPRVQIIVQKGVDSTVPGKRSVRMV